MPIIKKVFPLFFSIFDFSNGLYVFIYKKKKERKLEQKAAEAKAVVF